MFENLFSLDGRTALITGGSRGIGKMIAAGFIAHGAKVYISSRKADQCNATADELSQGSDRCISIPQNISTVEGCKSLTEEYQSREGHLDILVNNAGAAWGADFEEFPEHGWDKVMDLNVQSPFFLTQGLYKTLKQAASDDRPAKVINIASIDGIRLKLDNGWALIRISNTQPVIVCRFESNTEENLQKIKDEVFNKMDEFGNFDFNGL